MADNKEHNIIFGAGELFIVEGDIDLDTAEEAEIEAASTLVGSSSGEAGLIMEQEFHDVFGGKGHHLLKSFRTSETILFNAGIATLDLENLSKIVASQYEESGDTRTLKLGGNYSIPVNALRFIHTKEDGKRLIINIYKAMNKAGFELNFQAEEHSVFNFEFTLMKAKGKENIVTIIEEI